MGTAALVVVGLLAAIAVGKAIKNGRDDVVQFSRDLTDPNRDNRRDDLGDQS